MDVILLSRIQFAVTTMFHILFPTLTIGLSPYLVLVEFLWLWTKQEIYYRMYRFWVKIFAINFAVGVVSGVVLEFEFGTNFSNFSQMVGNVFSPLLAFEVMTAFFLEAGFLGIMLFGWERVRPGIHFLATCLGLLRKYPLWILDLGCKLLDADSGWIQSGRRKIHGDRLSNGHLQSFHSQSSGPHDHGCFRGLCFHGGRYQRLLSA